MPEINPIVEVEHIFFQYAEENVLQDVSFTLARGDYVGLVGGNGSGKTTLLRIMLGLLKPAQGTVKLYNTPLADFHQWQKIGYIPQHVFRGDLNFPATVEEVVESGHVGAHRMQYRARSGACDAVGRALERAGIIHLMKKRIGALSGGERQRVFIARSLISEPELLVLDEPTTGIDAETEKAFYAFLETLNRSGMAIILVSHDLEAVAREVKTVLCLNHRLVCVGAPENLRSQAVLHELYGHGKQMMSQEH